MIWLRIYYDVIQFKSYIINKKNKNIYQMSFILPYIF